MKKFTSLLIGLSLILAGAAFAQQPDASSTPTNEKATEKTQATETKSGNAANPEATVAEQHGAKTERAAAKTQNAEGNAKAGKSAGAQTNASAQPTATMTPGAKTQAAEGRKGKKGRSATASTAPSVSPTTGASASPASSASATPATTASVSAATTTSASAAPSVAATAGQQKASGNSVAAAKKPDPQQVQQIKQQHATFRAQARPEKVPAVTFNPSYRIEGSTQWQGPQYEVFRSYRPERHDQVWYQSHYGRVELIGGGYYYWNNGYWYPAWGYNPTNEYYAYDGPIYVGHRAEPPDRVIADVQAELQQMGYYRGEVDGLLGPLTRQALRAYQADQGLIATAVIDEPTLDALGLS